MIDIYILCVFVVICSLLAKTETKQKKKQYKTQTRQDSYKGKKRVLDGSLFNLLRALYGQGQASYPV
jgi:uncharacterized membrane protein